MNVRAVFYEDPRMFASPGGPTSRVLRLKTIVTEDIMAATNPNQTTTLSQPTSDSKNIQATKYYVFNETGNIMMASTDNSSEVIQQSVRDVFAEVAVFFAATTKAITTTMNPAQGQPYTIYNYTALQNVIGGSGLFVQVTEEDVSYTSQSVGV